MSESFVFSKVYPLNSITNPDVVTQDYMDSQAPFSFFDFLKYTRADLSPIQFNDLYMDYIRDWNIEKSAKETTINDSIKDRYVELLKQITLKYTTAEEKRFLANIDYSDEFDLDIVIPFYSKKIREICNFYAEKREQVKFKIQKNKSKGTPTSVEKAVFETIVDTIFTDQLEVGTYQKLVNSDTLLTDLNIEIEELYDLYSSYLDNDPDKSYTSYDVNTELRKTLYSSNINSIDGNIFINTDQAIKNQIFSNLRVFLAEFGKAFTINYDLTKVNLNCKSTDALYDLVTNNKDKAAREVELRYKLIKKYIGTDFYYIQTGETLTDVTSAKLFTADNPTGNLLNRHFPTTASVEEESELESCRRIGLFFTPENNSILYYSVPDKKYKVDESKLEINKLYIFPDPNRYGNTTGLTRTYFSDYPLIHIEDYTKSIKSKSVLAVEGDINANPYTQNFYAYFSKNQLAYETGNIGLSSNLSLLHGIGILTKWCTDIWGNQYGLFKSKSRKNIIDNTITLSGERLILKTFDGGPLTWDRNGLLPDPMTTDSPNWVYPNIWASDYYYNILLDGGVGGYYNGVMTHGLFSQTVFDGGHGDRSSITFDVLLNELSNPDTLIIDGLTYNTTYPLVSGYEINMALNSFASPYTFVIDGNGFTRSPVNLNTSTQYTLDGINPDNSSSSAASFLNGYILSSVQYRELDGGYLTDTYDEVFDFTSRHHIIIDQLIDNSKTELYGDVIDDGYNNRDIRGITGLIYVKNIVTGTVLPLSSALAIQFDKYSSDISYEIYNEVIDFGIYNDIIWIKTKNYLVLEKILYDTDGFIYSGTSNNSISYALSSYLINITDPFFFENRDYGMISTVELSGVISNSSYIVPNIYKFSYKDCNITSIYPDSVTANYQNLSSSNPVRLIRVNNPKFTYNSRNNKYALLTILEDSNEFPYIWSMLFDYNGSDVSNEDIKLYNTIDGDKMRTFNIYDTHLFVNDNTVYQNISGITLIQENDYIQLG